jgi:hypothetical protein
MESYFFPSISSNCPYTIVGRVIALTYLMVVLMALLGGEYLALRSEHNKPVASPRYRPPMVLTHDQSPTDSNIQAEVDTILARPMFGQSRRPSPISGSTPAALPRLTGVLISSHSKTAIFSGGPAVNRLHWSRAI